MNKKQKAAPLSDFGHNICKKETTLDCKQKAFFTAAKGHSAEFLLSNINCLPLFLQIVTLAVTASLRQPSRVPSGSYIFMGLTLSDYKIANRQSRFKMYTHQR